MAAALLLPLPLGSPLLGESYARFFRCDPDEVTVETVSTVKGLLHHIDDIPKSGDPKCILVEPGVYSLPASASENVNGEWHHCFGVIRSTLAIVAKDKDKSVVIDAMNWTCHFDVRHGADVFLDGLTLTNGVTFDYYDTEVEKKIVGQFAQFAGMAMAEVSSAPAFARSPASKLAPRSPLAACRLDTSCECQLGASQLQSRQQSRVGLGETLWHHECLRQPDHGQLRTHWEPRVAIDILARFAYGRWWRNRKLERCCRPERMPLSRQPRPGIPPLTPSPPHSTPASQTARLPP